MIKNHNWRVFFAIPLSSHDQEEVRNSLARSDVPLLPVAANPANWHVTLFFIQSIEHSIIDKLIQSIQKKTWHQKFELTLDHLGCFPEPKSAHTLWLGIGDGKSILMELILELSELLHEMGYPTSTELGQLSNGHPYNGHLTLSRLPEPQNLTDILKMRIHPIRLRVNRFSLFRKNSKF